MAFDPHEYSRLADLHAEIDYADKRSVAKANRAADRMRSMIIAAGGSKPDDDAVVYSLLDSDSLPTRHWAACHILELSSPDLPVARRAVAVIESAAENSELAGTTRMGLRYFLDEVRGKNPEYFAPAR